MLYCSSFAVSISSASATRDNRKDSVTNNTTRQGSQTTVGNKSIQTQNNRNITDVVYAAPSDAKTVRLELEKLGYFDGRYKLVKVEVNESKGDKKIVIGLPITQHCKSLCLSEGKGGLSSGLESVVLGWGEEVAPFSSSQMSKMANKTR